MVRDNFSWETGRCLARIFHLSDYFLLSFTLYLFSRLQICLAKGGAHYGTVRRVLMQLLVALENEKEGVLQPPPSARSDKEEAQSSSPQPQEEGGGEEVEEDEKVVVVAAAPAAAAVEGEGEDSVGKEEDEAGKRMSLVGMYGQAMEVLVLKVMLALGEGEAALERVRGDKHLEGRVRQVSIFEGNFILFGFQEILPIETITISLIIDHVFLSFFFFSTHNHRPSSTPARPP